MKSSVRSQSGALILLWAAAAVSMGLASRIESGGGNLQVSPIRIEAPAGTLSAKLCRPGSAIF